MGQKQAIHNFLFFATILVLPLIVHNYIVAIDTFKHLPKNEQYSLGVVYIGFAIFLVSKWPQIRNFDFFSFGVKKLPKLNKYLYILAYILMVGGSILALHFHHENTNIW